MIKLFRLMLEHTKIYKRIFKLQKIQSKLLDEMNLQIELHNRYKDISVSTYPMKTTDLLSDHIKFLEKQADILDKKMKEIRNVNKGE